MTEQTLTEQVMAHFAAGGRVMISTYTKSVIYSAKHATLFRAPRDASKDGIYVRHGKREDYVFPGYVFFVS